MAHTHTLLAISLLIAVSTLVPSARAQGVRLPSCWRVQQMQKEVSKLSVIARPAVRTFYTAGSPQP